MGDDGVGGDAGVDPGDPPPDFTNGVSTLAGSFLAEYIDGPRDIARFNNPVNVQYRDGKIYVADFDNGKIRVVSPDGTTGTVVAQPDFFRPFGMTFADDGTLYVSTDKDQTGNLTPMSGVVWRIDIAARKAVVVKTNLGRPRGLAALPDGRIAMADHLHHVIQILDPRTGVVTPLAGTWDAKGMVDGVGAAARFNKPYGMVVSLEGELIVSDFDNHRLRRVKLDGSTATLAGAGTAGFTDGGMQTAQFNHPQGMAIDGAGTIYVTDVENFRIRRIQGATVDTIAGDGTPGYLDNDNNLAGQFYGLEGLSITPDGNMLYLADGNRGEAIPYNRVRQINLNQ
ncbi:MAG: hypothetical protein H0T79_17965 [Deltaproteobacteria bacterium]|nr:hypothetical protein [Deltaproteobacteria bacterium]